MRAFIFCITASLHIRLRTVADQIMLLAVLQVFVKPLIILCSCRLVTVIGNDCDGV